MTTTADTSVDLNLPAVPGVKAPTELFNEFLLIYNAIRTLATGLDDYTLSGEMAEQIIALQAANVHAPFSELRKQYYRYTVPKFTVNTNLNVKQKFSLGDPVLVPPVAVQLLTKTPSTIPASGAGATAGAFDTAANRDAAIAAINNNSAALLEIQNFLKLFGFVK